MKEPKKVLINGAGGKMGQALIRLTKEYPQLGLTVAATRDAGQDVKEDFDIIFLFSFFPSPSKELLLLCTCLGGRLG